jgi:hypothetical protein
MFLTLALRQISLSGATDDPENGLHAGTVHLVFANDRGGEKVPPLPGDKKSLWR